jgi:hypothetical protein
MSLSTIGMSMSWTVPGITAGAVASKSVYLGAFGSATGAAAVALEVVGALEGIIDIPGIALPLVTAMAPVIPAAAWPGIEHRNDSPPAGTLTVPVAVLPASAVRAVPSAKVMLWVVAPSLTNVTATGPAAATLTRAGLKPRSKAWISTADAAAAWPSLDAAGVGAAEADDAAVAGAAVAGGNVQVGAEALLHPARATVAAMAIKVRLILLSMAMAP